MNSQLPKQNARDTLVIHDGVAVHDRETIFHDGWASSTPVASVRVRECFEAPTAVENQFILQKMGPLTGKRLLDVGAGLGESSVYFALQGANVTMIDISPQMIAKACDVGRHHHNERRDSVSILFQ